VTGLLTGVIPEELVDAISIVVSELVTNSVRHSGGQPGDPIMLRLRAEEEGARVEVVDEGRGFRPYVHRPPTDAESGWGLFLVEQLANRWGISDGGRVVWAELDERQAA
jgi:anti-sigma regulatory factor (Ser/Thr protein kinase)